MTPKSVLITGCSEGGIGDALAREFHAQGLRVFATARNLSKVKHLKDMGLEILRLDVTDDDSIAQAVQSVKALTGGTLDILVNNSGGGYSMPLLDSDMPTIKNMYDVNVFAVVTVTKAFAPLLIATKGTIINIGSLSGVFPLPWQGFYNATKNDVNFLTDHLRLELSPWGVKAINVVTGGIKTNFFENIHNGEAVHLPSDSLYLPATKEIEAVMAGELVASDAMDPHDYSAIVVKNALRSNPKKNLWVGQGTTRIWLAWAFGWATIWDYVLPSLVNLPTITKKIQAAEKLKRGFVAGVD
ncbi:hypothetical protein ACEPPN_006753 [Leptodophora sp. 'Broadleaf-Isolate-01']